MWRRRPVRILGIAICAGVLPLAVDPGAAAALTSRAANSPRAATAATAATSPRAATAPNAATLARTGTDRGLRSALRAVVDAGATGVIARVDDGDDVTRIGVGAARLDPYRAIGTDDEVRVGSITKSMVATVALQLVGEGRLALDDTLQQWLPGVVPGADQITIRMLLNHTSGIYNYTDDPDFIPAVLANPYRYWSPAELIAVATSHPPVFAPGTSWSYSNTNYILVGLVLEKITGTPIQTLLARRIIRPLHLRGTFFATSGAFGGPYAHGYLPPSLTGAGYVDASGWPPSWAWAAGAVVSTAPDLARFYRALLSGRLLTPRLLAQMTTTVEVAPGFGYGLGIYTQETPCGTVWGHDGGIPGYVSFAFTDRTGARSAVVLLPTQPDDAIAASGQRALEAVVCAMFDRPVPDPAAAARSAAGFTLHLTG
jgi:D-alanyl-D-alanine carboxypeptidase